MRGIASLFVTLLAASCGGRTVGDRSRTDDGGTGEPISPVSVGDDMDTGSPSPAPPYVDSGSVFQEPDSDVEEVGPPEAGIGDEWNPPTPPAFVPFDPQTSVGPAALGCIPFNKVTPTPFVAANDSADQIRNGMAGSWIGTATSPWGNWYVTITFSGTGHYDALGYSISPPASNPPSFYYGTDSDDPSCLALKQWSPTSLAVPFWYGTYCGLPAWQGELSGAALDTTGDRLDFAFSRSDGYGPIDYDLYRTCTP
jgi:hypothetical protein